VSTAPATEELLSAIWTRRIAWSRAADALRRRLAFANVTVLALSVIGALLVAVAATLLFPGSVGQRVCAVGGAVALALIPVINARYITREATSAWIRARSMSEAIKAEVFLFRSGAAPYGDRAAVGLLQTHVMNLNAASADLEGELELVKDAPAPLPPLSGQAYVEKRVVAQIEGFYRPKADLYARRAAWFRRAQIVLALAAALGAVVAGVAVEAAKSMAVWVAFLTTTSTALTAQVAATRYNYLINSYLATARRLEDLVAAWKLNGEPSDGADWSKFAQDCEAAISAENESWLAKWVGARATV
jgi:hypothetical protein